MIDTGTLTAAICLSLAICLITCAQFHGERGRKTLRLLFLANGYLAAFIGLLLAYKWFAS